MEGGHLSLLGAYDAELLPMRRVRGRDGCCRDHLESESGGGRCQSAFKINFFLGDYVEACYPYMERSAKVNAAAHLGAALSGAVLLASSTGEAVTRSSAYLPLPLAVAISNGVAAMALAVALAVGVPCVLSFL